MNKITYSMTCSNCNITSHSEHKFRFNSDKQTLAYIKSRKKGEKRFKQVEKEYKSYEREWNEYRLGSWKYQIPFLKRKNYSSYMKKYHFDLWKKYQETPHTSFTTDDSMLRTKYIKCPVCGFRIYPELNLYKDWYHQ